MATDNKKVNGQLYFNENLLDNYTRKQAYELYIPQTKAVSTHTQKSYEKNMTITNIFRLKFIPPLDMLLKWQSELQKNMSSPTTYIEFT